MVNLPNEIPDLGQLVYEHLILVSIRHYTCAVTRRLFLLVLAATCLLAEDFTGRVVGISDGDTIRVLHEGRAERVRLWGIDAPESGQPWGTRAKQFTGDLAFGKTVTVRVREIDRYKHTVAEIILPDDRHLNQELMRS